jgi:isoleucyl-tRNA synthetase
VFSNIQDWNAMTERIGFWLDLENAYVTYTNDYIESCWWVMRQLWDRGLLAEDYKTTWHSPSSNTTLASHEVALGYEEDVEDPSVFPKFAADRVELAGRGLLPADESRPVWLLAWTTTPWTLAANTGLAVAADATYVLVEGPTRLGEAGSGELYWLAEALAPAVFGDAVSERVLARAPGARLEGLSYRPLLRGSAPPDASPARGFRVVTDPFVSLEDGTGIVHLAPAYGDLELGRKHDLPTLFSVDLTGRVLPEVRPLDAPEGGDGPYAGRWFKDADSAIAADLPLQLARRHAPDERCQEELVHPHHRAQGQAARQQRQGALVPGPHPHGALRQVAREQRRLGAEPRALLGRAAADLGER